MFSSCPQCDHEFTQAEKKRMSTKRPQPCPQCQAKLIKNKDSTKRMNLGVALVLAPTFILVLVSITAQITSIAIPDNIKMPLCLLIAAPLLLSGLLLTIKGSNSAKLEIATEPENE